MASHTLGKCSTTESISLLLINVFISDSLLITNYPDHSMHMVGENKFKEVSIKRTGAVCLRLHTGQVLALYLTPSLMTDSLSSPHHPKPSITCIWVV